MGFWDARLSDLEARGVQFSEDEVEILERGGYVVHLHPQEGAEPYGDAERDASGEIVLTVEVVRAVSPLDLYSPAWQKVPVSVAEYFDKHYHRREWTSWPAYTGLLDLEMPTDTYLGWDTCMHECRAEDLNLYSWWNCVPYTPEMDPALRVLIKAQADRHAAALWNEMYWLNDLWQNYLDPLDCWIYTMHPHVLSEEQEHEIMATVVNEIAHDEEQALEWIKQTAAEMDELYRTGAIPFPDSITVNDVEIPNPYPHVTPTGCLPWRPLEEFIPPHEVEALDLWNRLNARRRLGLARTPRLGQRGLYMETVD